MSKLSIKDLLKTELARLEASLVEVEERSEILDQALGAIVKAGGKRLRPAFVFLIVRAFLNHSTDQEQLGDEFYKLARAVELMHVATLMHDDIVDKAVTRRGIPSTHVVWGEKLAIICGDYLFSKASKILSELNDTRISGIFSQVLIDLCLGELKQAEQVFSISSLDLDGYILKSKRKTASLFSATCGCTAILLNRMIDVQADTSGLVIDSMLAFGENYGIAFQILDDLKDFSTETSFGKPLLNDLKTGIYTAPLIYLAGDPRYRYELREVLKSIERRKSIKDDELRELAKKIMGSSAITQSVELLTKYVTQAKQALRAIPHENQYKQMLLNSCDELLKINFI